MNRISRDFKGWAAIGAALAVAATLLAACDEYERNRMALTLSEPATAHPIAFSARTEILNIEVPPKGEGLSHNQYADVYRFLRRYRAEANGHLTLSLPGTGRETWGAARAIDDVRQALREAEVDENQVRKGHHTAGRRHTGVIRLSYARPLAIAPECGHWERDVGLERERVPFPNWGCATQRNLAGMVANSRDLQRPQDEDPRSSERRSQTWSKYLTPEGGIGGGGGNEQTNKAAATAKK